MSERWLPVVGWEGFYSVSDLGRVRSEDREIIDRAGVTHRRRGLVLKQLANHRGYFYVTLNRCGQKATARVHVMVMKAFVGPRPDGLFVCHNDGDPSNNQLSNLRYGTNSENQLDSVEHGTHHETRKTHCKRGHLLAAPNLREAELERHGWRACLACYRARNRARAPLSPDRDSLADAFYTEIMAEAVGDR